MPKMKQLHSCRSSLPDLPPPPRLPENCFCFKTPLFIILPLHPLCPSSFIHAAPIPLIKYHPCSAAAPCQGSDKRGTDGEWEGGVKGSPKSRSPSYTICSTSVDEIYYLAAIIALISSSDSSDFCRGLCLLFICYHVINYGMWAFHM